MAFEHFISLLRGRQYFNARAEYYLSILSVKQEGIKGGKVILAKKQF